MAYKRIPNGTSIDIQGLKVWIPPFGMGCHSVTGEIAPCDIIKRSTKKAEQYWEPQQLPLDFEDRVNREEELQREDQNYIDQELEVIREREWRRRMYGVWFYNEGEPVYLTGLNYFFLNYWELDSGLPDFRKIDVEYYYFWQYCVEDPKCYGEIEVRKRRDGKSYRAGCMLYECVSRTKKALGGIQSKEMDSASELFDKAIVPQFQKLPSFFRPIWDTSAGSTPRGSLRFFKPSKKGKGATKALRGVELESQIDYRNSKPKAYDGSKTVRLVLDESGKVETDVIARHQIVQPCLEDNRGKIVGKMLVTSTVEQLGIKYKFDDLWDWSNQEKILETGTTKSGLYRFFMPAHRAGDYDIYGTPKEAETLKDIHNKRLSYSDNQDALIAYMRKFPLTWQEAFKIATQDCLYNSIAINQRISDLSWDKNLTERGDFVWKDGKQFTEVEWARNPKGKWEVAYLLPEEERNKVNIRGNQYFPNNRVQYCAGSDPFDMGKTKSGKGSKGTIYIKWRFSIHHQHHAYNNSLTVRYSYRTQSFDMFVDDVIKTLWFHGAELLLERNKYGLAKEMIRLGCGGFLIWLAGEVEPGVYASTESNEELVRVTQSYLVKYMHKVWFIDTCEQWLKFDINNTEDYDEAMGAGYALMADTPLVPKKQEVEVTTDINDIFRSYKIPQHG